MQRRQFIQGLCACCGSLGLSELLGATHEVKKGDTFFSVSRQCEVSVADLMNANPGIDPTKLRPGQVLQIPAKEPASKEAGKTEIPTDKSPGNPKSQDTNVQTDGEKPSKSKSEIENQKSKIPETPSPAEFHTVVKGDTLFSIARQYALPMAELRQLNPATSDILSVGQKLRIRKAGPTTLVIDAGPPSEPNEKADGKPPAKSKSEIENQKSKTPEPPPPQYVFITGKTKAQIDKPKITTRDWRYIVVHHSGTRTGNAKIFDYYHRHVRGMENGLAYHFVIGNGTDSGDGQIEVGDRWYKQLQGGHVRSDAQNEIAIGICLVGDFQADRPTRRQVSALIELIGYLQGRVGDPKPLLFLHRDINIISTDCPGRNFPAAALYRLFGGQPKKPKE